MKRKRKVSNRVITIILIIILLIGLSVLLYPTISNTWNERVQSRVVVSYDEAVANMSEENYTAWFEAAYAYNEAPHVTLSFSAH